MAKKILYQDNARRALERGMEVMVEAVSVTVEMGEQIFFSIGGLCHRKISVTM